MEKVIYAAWARDGEHRAALNAWLTAETAPALLALDTVHGLRLNLQDRHTIRAEGLRLRCSDGAQPDAVAQLWIDAAHDAFRAPIDAIMRASAGSIAAWSVVESTIVANRDYPPRPGERTWGWAQVCFLRRPDRLDQATWLHNWRELHTRVAIDTQSNFEYRQNLIVRPLIAGPQDYAAIVEECFPAEAMDDAHVFFDAVDDETRFAANTAAMAQSCARFIDEGGVDLLPTSQYDLKPLR
jgi:hypothetical protein